MHYVSLTIYDDNTYVIRDNKQYIRTTNTYTMVPGRNNGLYPSKESAGDMNISFRNMGFKNHNGIYIGWPTNKIHSGSKVATELQEITIAADDELDEEKSNTLQDLQTVIDVGIYRAGYKILDEQTVYKVIALGYGMYRGIRYNFIQCRT